MVRQILCIDNQTWKRIVRIEMQSKKKKKKWLRKSLELIGMYKGKENMLN